MYDYDINISKVEQASNNLKDIALDMELTARHVERAGQMVENAWKGTGAANTVGDMNQISQNIRNLKESLEGFSRQFRSSANQARAAQEENMRRIAASRGSGAMGGGESSGGGFR